MAANDAARKRVEQTILGAEKFKATIGPPKGKSDEDFFHLMTHVDTSLKEKIVNGEYVELQKLLPKDKKSQYKTTDGENLLEWVRTDQGTFLLPVSDRENKINNVKRWDQAFRVYATVYCGAHPMRAQEVWQYIDIIHTAAATFGWENMATYDHTFRKLMAFNPQQSWATTYSQMWNICMTDPINRSQSVNIAGRNFTTSASSS